MATSQTYPDGQPKRVVLEQAAQAFADANANPPFLYQLAPEDGRAIAHKVQTDPTPATKPADIGVVSVPGGPRGSIPVTIVRPEGIPSHTSNSLRATSSDERA